MFIGKRDIAKLKVKCDNVKRGCTWVGTVRGTCGQMRIHSTSLPQRMQ